MKYINLQKRWKLYQELVRRVRSIDKANTIGLLHFRERKYIVTVDDTTRFHGFELGGTIIGKAHMNSRG